MFPTSNSTALHSGAGLGVVWVDHNWNILEFYRTQSWPTNALEPPERNVSD